MQNTKIPSAHIEQSRRCDQTLEMRCKRSKRSNNNNKKQFFFYLSVMFKLWMHIERRKKNIRQKEREQKLKNYNKNEKIKLWKKKNIFFAFYGNFLTVCILLNFFSSPIERAFLPVTMTRPLQFNVSSSSSSSSSGNLNEECYWMERQGHENNPMIKWKCAFECVYWR